MSPEFIAVTSLYDIGRAQLDGRSVDDYIGWLNKTLRLPIPFVIFLDPIVDRARVVAKADDRIVVLPKEEISSFAWREKVEAICRDGKNIVAGNDLTYRLPAYALVQFAKFDLIRRAAALAPQAKGIFWIDAGIARFFSDDLAGRMLDSGALQEKIATASLIVNVTPTLQRGLAHGAASKKYVGTCERLVTGETFLIRASAAAEIQKDIEDYVTREWLPHDLWDNEQVALGDMILGGLRQGRNLGRQRDAGAFCGAGLSAPDFGGAGFDCCQAALPARSVIAFSIAAKNTSCRGRSFHGSCAIKARSRSKDLPSHPATSNSSGLPIR